MTRAAELRSLVSLLSGHINREPTRAGLGALERALGALREHPLLGTEPAE